MFLGPSQILYNVVKQDICDKRVFEVVLLGSMKGSWRAMTLGDLKSSGAGTRRVQVRERRAQ